MGMKKLGNVCDIFDQRNTHLPHLFLQPTSDTLMTVIKESYLSYKLCPDVNCGNIGKKKSNSPPLHSSLCIMPP